MIEIKEDRKEEMIEEIKVDILIEEDKVEGDKEDIIEEKK
jgi:hypothetical protein